ncbi:hypothetical protein [Gordonia sp. (in: high G+C Gram-positive bacteria)]|uniref:hypothetical protein n=1 Tax=Gordonia sp. (in: high G+C Gram-positive bacteria) TaxID=84139 RepID=UPI0039E55492
MDAPLNRESVELLHVGLVNPDAPQSRIEIREYYAADTTLVELAEAMRARFVPDQIFDISYNEEVSTASTSFSVGEFGVIQTVMGFQVDQNLVLALEFQFTAPGEQFNKFREDYVTMLDTLELAS